MPEILSHVIVIAAKYLGIFVVGVLALAFVADRHLRSNGYKGTANSHFDGKKFFNIDGPTRQSSLFKIIGWDLSQVAEAIRPKNKWVHEDVEQVKPAARISGDHLVVTFINHATVLIQTEELNVLTDPIYAERASPFSWIGPKRHTDPGVAFDDLPKIDAVLISHNHYDHLDLSTLSRLAERDHSRIIIPPGNASLLQKHGITGAVELDWWQARELSSSVSVVSVPGQHFSARALSDFSITGWGGYVIQAPAGDTYFAGDTGYGPFVNQIAERFPEGFRLGLLPIGAFLPRWLMSPVHIDPTEAVKIKDTLKIRTALAIHFGTFKLADDGQHQAEEDLQKDMAGRTDAASFHVLKNGGSLEVLPSYSGSNSVD